MNKRVLIMAGGTGGHVFPALAVAKELQELSWEVKWLGTPNSFESRVLAESQIPLLEVKVSGLRGKGLKKWLTAPLQLLAALYESVKHIKTFKPDLVVGLGGYVTGPGGVAAWLLRKKLVIHEQNALPGMTNKILSKMAVRVCESFPGTFTIKKSLVTTGNPVRDEITQVTSPDNRLNERKGPVRVLIMGGSQGARVFNDNLPIFLKPYLQEQIIEVWHQTGLKDATQVTASYGNTKVRVEPFIKDMREAYSWADLVICRAGATTISEIAAVGLASILVPFPQAVDDHQTKNALFLKDAGAAELLPQKDFTEGNLRLILDPLFQDERKTLREMAMIAYGLGKKDATENLVKECLGVYDHGK